MKKIFIAFLLSFFSYPMFAQFVSFQSVQADPVQVRPPVNHNQESLYDPLGLGSGSSTIQTPPPPQQNTNYTTVPHILSKEVNFIK